MMNISRIFLSSFIAATICAGATLQAQAATVTLTFDVPTGSAENYYASDGVTFSGGGLLADGASGGKSGQPQFLGDRIGTYSKESGSAYSDSFFDIWVHFTNGASNVSGDYISNLGHGGKVIAYSNTGAELDTVDLSALSPPTTAIGSLGTFDFGFLTTNVAKLHMISDSATVATMLDNLTYSPAPVPVPAAVWLFGSGLIGLIGMRRKASKAAALPA